jgi:hypothetical protein
MARKILMCCPSTLSYRVKRPYAENEFVMAYTAVLRENSFTELERSSELIDALHRYSLVSYLSSIATICQFSFIEVSA